mmetsp:Transcript_26662/g.67670  ORF Transcript_26662/g.67670 Transcript_26662/m.67670 type:complete len:214 (-) Transcript_26662:7-648(-)
MLCLTSLAVAIVTLSDVRTPTLVIDVDAIARDRSLEQLVALGVDAELEAELGPAAYLHTRVAASSLQRRPRYHKDASYALARLDTPLPAGGAYLAMGLNNDYDASYYWARHAGPSSRAAVPGIGVREGDLGLAEIFRLSEEEGRRQGNLQPNDGKWSEWCEFLKPGDQVDLVPTSALAALRAAGGALCGISRADRPLGAEPEVLGTWTRATTP